MDGRRLAFAARWSWFWSFSFEHLEHAQAHEEAAEGVDGCQRDGNGSEQRAAPRGGRTRREDRAHDDHGTDRVGDAHQRGMQRRRDVPDNVISDEDRQHEHGEVGDGVIHMRYITTFPSAQTSAPAMISSSRLTLGAPDFESSSRLTNASTLRA